MRDSSMSGADTHMIAQNCTLRLNRILIVAEGSENCAELEHLNGANLRNSEIMFDVDHSRIIFGRDFMAKLHCTVIAIRHIWL
jgi:hypothetical protein